MVCFREKVLRLDGVNQRESEQIALTGESRIPPSESFLAHPPVRIHGDEVSLPDHVQRTRRRLHRPKRNASHNLLVEIVLPVADLPLKLVEPCLLGFWQQMWRVAANVREHESIFRQRRFFAQERAQTTIGDGENL